MTTQLSYFLSKQEGERIKGQKEVDIQYMVELCVQMTCVFPSTTSMYFTFKRVFAFTQARNKLSRCSQCA